MKSILLNLRKVQRGEIGFLDAAKNIWWSGCRRIGLREFGRRYFDKIYRSQDPWHYETSSYEKRKYESVLAALPQQHFEHTLEIGCSIGVFTEMVAARTNRLTAVDISAAAVAQAEFRTRHLDHVRVRRADFLSVRERAAFDLILAAEVLYFMWQPLRLRRKARARLVSLLADGGTLVLVWGGYRLEQDWDAFLQEDKKLRLQTSRLFNDPERPYRISLFQPTTMSRGR